MGKRLEDALPKAVPGPGSGNLTGAKSSQRPGAFSGKAGQTGRSRTPKNRPWQLTKNQTALTSTSVERG